MQLALWIIGTIVYLSIGAISLGYYRSMQKSKDEPLLADFEGEKYRNKKKGKLTKEYDEAILRSFWGYVIHGVVWPLPVMFRIITAMLSYPHKFGMKLFEAPTDEEEALLIEYDDAFKLSEEIEKASREAEKENEKEKMQRMQRTDESREERFKRLAFQEEDTHKW